MTAAASSTQCCCEISFQGSCGPWNAFGRSHWRYIVQLQPLLQTVSWSFSAESPAVCHHLQHKYPFLSPFSFAKVRRLLLLCGCPWGKPVGKQSKDMFNNAPPTAGPTHCHTFYHSNTSVLRHAVYIRTSQVTLQPLCCVMCFPAAHTEWQGCSCFCLKVFRACRDFVNMFNWKQSTKKHHMHLNMREEVL